MSKPEPCSIFGDPTDRPIYSLHRQTIQKPHFLICTSIHIPTWSVGTGKEGGGGRRGAAREWKTYRLNKGSNSHNCICPLLTFFFFGFRSASRVIISPVLITSSFYIRLRRADKGGGFLGRSNIVFNHSATKLKVGGKEVGGVPPWSLSFFCSLFFFFFWYKNNIIFFFFLKIFFFKS